MRFAKVLYNITLLLFSIALSGLIATPAFANCLIVGAPKVYGNASKAISFVPGQFCTIRNNDAHSEVRAILQEALGTGYVVTVQPRQNATFVDNENHGVDNGFSVKADYVDSLHAPTDVVARDSSTSDVRMEITPITFQRYQEMLTDNHDTKIVEAFHITFVSNNELYSAFGDSGLFPNVPPEKSPFYLTPADVQDSGSGWRDAVFFGNLETAIGTGEKIKICGTLETINSHLNGDWQSFNGKVVALYGYKYRGIEIVPKSLPQTPNVKQCIDWLDSK
ncbi:MAG: hypothetical protein WAN35_21725 [Terracidiphilus sp.]